MCSILWPLEGSKSHRRDLPFPAEAVLLSPVGFCSPSASLLYVAPTWEIGHLPFSYIILQHLQPGAPPPPPPLG